MASISTNSTSFQKQILPLNGIRIGLILLLSYAFNLPDETSIPIR